MDGQAWQDISAECKDFIRSLLHMDPSKRLSAQAALEHPWIARNCTASENTTQTLTSLRQFGRASEFRRCCLEVLAWASSNEDQAKVRDHFLAMNVSQQGSMTFEELRTAMFNEFPAMEDVEFEQICYALDYNHDKRVHYSDFLAAMMGSQITLTHDMMEIAFRRLDVDNSGLITANDLNRRTNYLDGENAESLIQEIAKSREGICFKQFSSYLERPCLDTNLPCDANSSPHNSTGFFGGGNALSAIHEFICFEGFHALKRLAGSRLTRHGTTFYV